MEVFGLKMNDVMKIFKNVESKLSAQPWFIKEKWVVSVHGFPINKPQFITFHVFKNHWFNEDKQGIHIESYLAIDPKERKKSYITMHVLHHSKIPGTKLKRTAISQPFVDEIYDLVNTWEGYKFRAGKYGTQPFTKVLDGTSDDFEKILTSELTRMCRKLGPVMDKVIKQVIA